MKKGMNKEHLYLSSIRSTIASSLVSISTTFTNSTALFNRLAYSSIALAEKQAYAKKQILDTV